MSKAQLDLTGWSCGLKSLWKEVFMVIYPRCLLDSNFYPFCVYWVFHIHLVHSIPSPPRKSQLLTALTQNDHVLSDLLWGVFSLCNYLLLVPLLGFFPHFLRATPLHPEHNHLKTIPKLHLSSCPMGMSCQSNLPTCRAWITSVCGPGFPAMWFSLAQSHLWVSFPEF